MDHNSNTRYFVTMKAAIDSAPRVASLATAKKISLDRIPASAAAIALAFFLFACGGEKPAAPEAGKSTAKLAPPTIEQAHELLAASPEFGDYQFTHASLALPLERSRMNEPAREAAHDLEKGGWIETQRDHIVLSSKSAEDKRFNVRPNGFLEIVPLAKKEITEVGAVAESPDEKPIVTFCFKWIPNAVGVSLTKGSQKERFGAMHCAKATLIRIGEKWEVKAIEESVKASG